MSGISGNGGALRGDLLLWLERRVDGFIEQRLSSCESPIERAIGEDMLCLAISTSPGILNGLPAYHFFDVEPQVSARNYRLDFLVTMYRGKRSWSVAVECDGHAFHERTKEQAMRDKSRDRILAIDGIHTLRFTGAEIHADSCACAEQVFQYLTEIARREAGRDE